MTFTESGILTSLVEALARDNITEPTPIQIAAVPALLAGKSAYLNAETGTGKTLAYLLPLFCRMDPALAATQAVVVAPTHELAIQIQRVAGALAQNAGLPLRSVLLIGGTMLQRQIDKLKKKPHLVIGSPGRIRELIGANKLKTRLVRSIVIDEADRLLSGESLEAVRDIVRASPPERQLIFASATERPECSREAAALAPGLDMLRTAATPVSPRIEHLYLVCEERDKPALLRKLIHALNPERALVFVHRNARAETVAGMLASRKLAVADLHAAFDKSERKKAMDDFRSGRANVLIASDVAARGLDIKGVTHVFNLDMPTESKAYLHRVGRTARAGARGFAVSLMNENEVRLARRYEAELGIRMTPMRLREGRVLPAGAGPGGD
jgi:ATP-dependent RNA helicase DeaD